MSSFKTDSVKIDSFKTDSVKIDSDTMDFITMEKYYNGIIDNMRINLKTAEERIKRLQHSEFKLEADIEDLKYKLNQIKNN